MTFEIVTLLKKSFVLYKKNEVLNNFFHICSDLFPVKKYSMGTIDSSDPNINMNNKDKTAKKDHNNTNNNKLNNKTNNNNNNKYITNNKPNGKAETRKPSNLKNKSTLNENRFQKTQDLRKNKLAPMKNFKKFSEENELKNENKNNVSGKKDGNFNKNFNSSGPSVYVRNSLLLF